MTWSAVTVTTAINILQEQEEKEIDRQFKAQSVSGNVHLDLVKLEGELKIRNLDEQRDRFIIVFEIMLNTPHVIFYFYYFLGSFRFLL